MVDRVSFYFKVNYFISSFLIPYFYMLIVIFVQLFENHEMKLFNYLWNYNGLVLILLAILIIISLLSTMYVFKKLKQDLEYSKSNGERKIKLELQYNKGIRDFMLSVIIPVFSTVSLIDRPLTGFISMTLLQMLLAYFYINSTEFFPNLTLIILGYSLGSGINEDGKELFLFVKSKYIKRTINQQVEYIYIGDKDYSNIGIVVEDK